MRNDRFNLRKRRTGTKALSGHFGGTLPALTSLALPVLLSLLLALLTQGCSSAMVDQQGHGETVRQALQAQRLAPGAGSATQGPAQPAATELQGALQNHLRPPAANTGHALTPVLPEAGR
jgi:hypothetical protein